MRQNSSPISKSIRRTVFINVRTGKPLTPPGLKHVVSEACAGVVSGAAVAGGLPQLTPELRREVLAPGTDMKAARDLMMIFHTAFSSARVGEAASFDIGDIEVFGRDHNGLDTRIPLVDKVLPDGTTVVGILDRIAVITETDLLDHTGTSLYGSGIVMGIYNRFKHGTKTKRFHENWYPAQAGHPACPVRLVMLGLKAYDRALIAYEGRRLRAGDPMFTSLKKPGRRFTAKGLSRVLGETVKALVSELGLDPRNYSAHTLRKVRATYVFSKGGSQLNVMTHDSRSSLASNLPYVQIDPRNPFAGDPTVNFYDNVDTDASNTAGAPAAPSSASQCRTTFDAGGSPSTSGAASSTPDSGSASSPAQHETTAPGHAPSPVDNITSMPCRSAADPPPEPPDPRTADSPTAAQAARKADADPAITVARWISDLRASVNELRSAGLDDSTVAALAGLLLP